MKDGRRSVLEQRQQANARIEKLKDISNRLVLPKADVGRLFAVAARLVQGVDLPHHLRIEAGSFAVTDGGIPSHRLRHNIAFAAA